MIFISTELSREHADVHRKIRRTRVEIEETAQKVAELDFVGGFSAAASV